MTVLGVPLHLTGVVGIQEVLPLAISYVWFASGLAALALFIWSKVDVGKLMSVFGLVLQVLTSIRIVVLISGDYHGSDIMIIFNMALALVIELFLALGLQFMTSLIVTGINIIGLVIAGFIIRNQTYIALAFTLTFVQVIINAYCLIARRILREKQTEVDEHVDNEDRFLRVFGMSRAEMVAIMQSCRNSDSDQPLDEAILKHLSERTKLGMINTAQQLSEAHRSNIEEIKKAFPMLSATEQEVCHQVMLGKTLNEIAELMGKSTSNISTVRGNIRRKLKLTPDIDLKDYLRKILQKN